MKKPALVTALLLLTTPAFALEPVASGAKVYINSMDGFGSYVAAAFRAKGVPLTVVANRAIADYEVIGDSESEKAGWAKIIFLKQTGSREEASISVVDVRTSEVVFAYNYNTSNSYRGKQSAAESCAKHLAAAIRQGGRFASDLPPLTPEQVQAATKRESKPESPAVTSEQHPLIAQVKAEIPQAPITVRFISIPANAEVQIDGEYLGSTPTVALTRLTAGSHTIVVKKPGYQNWERKITLVPGDDRAINAELEAKPNDPTKPRITGLD